MKILVGLSGGVDSAVAAYLLKQQGLDVTCAFMRNWDSMANNDFLGNPNADDDVCPQEKDWMDAKSVADSLGLELLRVDFVKEYWDNVFSNFCRNTRRAGRRIPIFCATNTSSFPAFSISPAAAASIRWRPAIMRVCGTKQTSAVYTRRTT